MLGTLYLGEMQMTGTIPSEIGLVPLRDIRIQENMFTGVVPGSIGQSQFLRKFSASNMTDGEGHSAIDGRYLYRRFGRVAGKQLHGACPHYYLHQPHCGKGPHQSELFHRHDPHHHRLDGEIVGSENATQRSGWKTANATFPVAKHHHHRRVTLQPRRDVIERIRFIERNSSKFDIEQ
mmetsp:Transcript_23701/g.55215  ORF Transcript_23701/g.55215 Transcript_23701/m.55215 type:complete len:178 (+) Transcript_23701:2298-2831(+)